MKLIITFFAICVFSILLKAQDTVVVNEKFYKNELGINLAPVAVGIFGGIPAYETNLALTYRHFMNDKRAIRIRPSISFFDAQSKSLSEIVSLTDSTKVTENYNKSISASPSLNIGYELNWGKKKIKWFSGCDIYYNYNKEENYIMTVYSSIDSSTLSSGYLYYATDSILTEKINTIRRHSLGVSPFVGIRFDINNKYSISANTSFTFGLGFAEQDVFLNNFYLRSYNWKEWNFNLISVISDVSLIIKF